MQKGANDWKENQLTVALRVRPLTEDEQEVGAKSIVQIVDDQMVLLMDPADDPKDVLRVRRSREKHYCFDHVFGPQCPQDEVYSKTTKVLIDSVTMGFNATVFAYGATGAGKTYTMLGTDQKPGIMARALEDLFQEMDRTSEQSVYKVTMSYLEIYNEMIRDLLNPSSGYLDLREHSSGVVQVAGISEVCTNSSTEVMDLLTRGNKERTQEPTAANKTSSRSHAVLQVTVRQRDRVRGVKQSVRTGKLFMIDLAGSERASQTKNRGKRMIEGAHINRSLLALGNCINALCDGAGKYVNYRDSKLTRLLKDSLGGNCKTVMIANISPSSFFFEESRSTLSYADRAKKIKMKIKSNTTNVDYHIAQYTNIISELKREIKRLQQKISSHEEEERETAIVDAVSHKEMDLLRQQLMSNFNTQMGIRQKLIGVEQDTWKLSMEANKQLAVIADWEQDQLRLQSKSKPRLDLAFKDLDSKHRDIEHHDGDTKSITSESPEPEEISNARQQLSLILRQRADCHSRKVELEESLQNVRKRGTHMEESLPNKATSNEQREILSMLCKVHELEIENTALKSKALYHTNDIEEKESTYLKMVQQRALCDKIISQQKQLLEENQILYSQELEELYEMYDVILREGVPPWKSKDDLSLPLIEEKKGSSVIMNSLQPAETDRNQGLEGMQEMRKSFKTLKTTEGTRRVNSPRSRVFNPSPKSWHIRERLKDRLPAIPQLRVQSPTSQLPRQRSLTSLSEARAENLRPDVQSSPTSVSLHQLSPPSRQPPPPLQGRREERRQMKNQTKSIAAKAARKKTVPGGGRQLDRRLAPERTPTSLNSLREVAEGGAELELLQPHSRISQPSRSTSQSSTAAVSRISIYPKDGAGSVAGGSISGGSVSRASVTSLDKKVEAGADKRVDYRGGVKKIHKTNREVMQQKMRRRGGAEGQTLPSQRKHPALTRASGGEGKLAKKPKPIIISGAFIKPTRLRYPVSHSGGIEEPGPVTMDSDSAPARTIHQLGAEKGKGHTVQRRLRGPAAVTLSRNGNAGSRKSSGPRRAGLTAAHPSAQSGGLLQVSGRTAPRRDSGGRKL